MGAQDSRRVLRRLGRWIMPLLFASAGFVILVAELNTALTSLRARSWPTVPGTVIASDLRRVQVKGGYAYEPQVTYRYEVDGQVLEGHAISASDAADTEQMARIILASYPLGRSLEVYVDPADPAHGLTQPGLSSGNVLSVLLAIVMLLAAGTLSPWFMRHKRGRTEDI